SIIHSMVEYIDGCVIAQLGIPDMALPIQYALTYPERKIGAAEAPNFAQLSKLTFFEPELEKTPCLALAMDCARRAGTAAAVMSAANEVAVDLFLHENLNFGAISDIVANAVGSVSISGTPTLEALQDADDAARRFVRENYRRY
ncbi:MAG: 1-deoxy-D-xylulose-5-phosphate reductoisomerase, partial [Clostridia bacterium]|nr:1-deoxy-D-xylulose-5-phosphate reductoisomerase [Clostridia bacterium]